MSNAVGLLAQINKILGSNIESGLPITFTDRLSMILNKFLAITFFNRIPKFFYK